MGGWTDRQTDRQSVCRLFAKEAGNKKQWLRQDKLKNTVFTQ